jgi:hypothetical protein
MGLGATGKGAQGKTDDIVSPTGAFTARSRVNGPVCLALPDEPLHAEPPHDTTADLLGERSQIGLGDRPSRQERQRPVNGLRENAVGRARMQMHVAIERRPETVQEGNAAAAHLTDWWTGVYSLASLGLCVQGPFREVRPRAFPDHAAKSS